MLCSERSGSQDQSLLWMGQREPCGDERSPRWCLSFADALGKCVNM